jgi:ADP-heptose:LPS heptosyltransferase
MALTGRPALLVLRALGLGDLLTAIPALRALARAFPGHRRVLAAPGWLAPLARWSGAVEEVLETEPLGPIALGHPALAVNLHGRGPQSHRRLLETGPRELVAFHHPAVSESAGLPRWRSGEHEVARWCRLLGECGIPSDPSDLELPARGLPTPRPAGGGTLIHPGGKDPARRWPPRRWAAVARAERDLGREVIVSAGPGEEGLARAVVSGAGLGPGAVHQPAGVLALAGLVAGADRVASGDTGVAHLATALGRPLVVLFGPAAPGEWGPPAGPRTVLWRGRSGLLTIAVQDVVEALRRLPPPAPAAMDAACGS